MTRLSRWTLWFLLVLAAIPFAAGCYTVIRHPEPGALASDEDGSRRACEDCHVDSRFYHDAFDPHFYGYGSYWSYPGWSDYYFRPWWYRDYWYYEPGTGGAAGTPVETDGRHMWGAGGRRELGASPPVFPGSSAIGSPAAASGAISGSPPSSPTTPGTGGTQTPKPAETGRAGDTHRSTPRRELGTPNAPKGAEPPTPVTPPKDPEDPDGKPPR